MQDNEIVSVFLTLPKGEADYNEEYRLRFYLEVVASQLSPDSEVYPPMGGGPGGESEAIEMLIALGSGGLIASSVKGFYTLIKAYLEYKTERELTFTREDKSITLKGRSEEEEIRMLKMLFPEAFAGEDVDAEDRSM